MRCQFCHADVKGYEGCRCPWSADARRHGFNDAWMRKCWGEQPRGEVMPVEQHTKSVVATPPVSVSEQRPGAPTERGLKFYAKRGDCAYCDARRQKEIDRVKRYRDRERKSDA